MAFLNLFFPGIGITNTTLSNQILDHTLHFRTSFKREIVLNVLHMCSLMPTVLTKVNCSNVLVQCVLHVFVYICFLHFRKEGRQKFDIVTCAKCHHMKQMKVFNQLLTVKTFSIIQSKMSL
jgi:hypothetical protein